MSYKYWSLFIGILKYASHASETYWLGILHVNRAYVLRLSCTLGILIMLGHLHIWNKRHKFFWNKHNIHKMKPNIVPLFSFSPFNTESPIKSPNSFFSWISFTCVHVSCGYQGITSWGLEDIQSQTTWRFGGVINVSINLKHLCMFYMFMNLCIKRVF